MNASLLLSNLMANLAGLGAKRLAILGLVGATIIGVLGFGVHFASRPGTVALYSGLDRQDVNAIGDALSREGILFDVSDDGESILVPPSNVTEARMLLAEKGLPRSNSAGYELFDQMGSLGLTSFMQEVTLVRALEGEIARTIQSMRGITGARVHIVLPDQSALGRDRRPPSASVMIRSDGAPFNDAGRAIRHLVAAAVPGLSLDQVTVMNTDGTMISGDSDVNTPNATTLLGFEKTVSNMVEQNIRRALMPYLGADNLRISVAAKLNTDRRQISETVFDPEGRVERSIRVVKELGDSTNSDGSGAVTVAEDLPEDQIDAAASSQNRESNERREETTSYEVSSKQTSTVSDGYAIENLSVAIVINKAALQGLEGDALVAQLTEIEAIAASASGVNIDRGDRIKLSALDFVAPLEGDASGEGNGLLASMASHMGSFVRALAFVVVAALLIFVVLKPAMRTLSAENTPRLEPTMDQQKLSDANKADENLAADIAAQLDNTAQKRLESIVALDEDKAIAVLKDWLKSA